MTEPVDLRELLIPVDVVKAVPVETYEIPSYEVDIEGQDDPLVVPARTMITPVVANLPDALKMGTGTWRVEAVIGTLWGAVWQILNGQHLTAVGRVTITSGIYEPAQTAELAVLWDEAPAAIPAGGAVIVYPAVAWMGRTTARIKPGTMSATGCTIVMTAIDDVTPSSSSPITYEVQAPYDYYPPAP